MDKVLVDRELLPCPFCGTSDLLGFEPSYEGGWTIVKCRKCGCSGSTGRSTSEREAIAWWNRRAKPEQSDLIEALRRLESANDQRSALMTSEAYRMCSLIPGMRDALLELDDARKQARDLLAAQGGEV
ncbi:TPA: Lar family restriction alleviation protein [Pseudomonas aeruginosa]